MKKLIGLILLFWAANLISQSSTIEIKNANGMYHQMRDIIPTADGGKLILSVYDSLSLIKLNSNNQISWAKALFEGIGTYKMELIEKNSNYYSCFQSSNFPNTVMYLMKTNNLGQMLFFKYIDYPTTANFQPHKKATISVNNSDEIIITSSLDEFMTIHKIDNVGNLVYGFKINTDTINNKNQGYSSVICNDDGVMLTGASDTSMVIVKLNSAGLFQWAKSYHLSLFNNSHPKKIIKTFDGNYAVSGFSIDWINQMGEIHFLMKVDSVGNLMWYKEYAVGANNNTYALTDLIELSNNNMLVYFENDASLLETDDQGNVVAAKRLSHGCENMHSSLNQIYINSIDRSTIITNGIIESNCLVTDTFSVSVSYAITSNSVVSSTYAKIESYGTLNNYPLTVSNTNVSVEQNCAMVGIKEINTNNNVKIYPNPTTSILNIFDENNQFQNATIEIKNYLGQVVFTTPFTSQINLSNLSSGMYFLTVQDKSSKKTVKIVKQ